MSSISELLPLIPPNAAWLVGWSAAILISAYFLSKAIRYIAFAIRDAVRAFKPNDGVDAAHDDQVYFAIVSAKSLMKAGMKVEKPANDVDEPKPLERP